MACISADGSLTLQARTVLAAFQTVHTPEAVSGATELPLFRIRSSLRELVTAGLLEASDGGYLPTEAGRRRLAASATR